MSSILFFYSRICRPVMHPAALNFTRSLTTPESGPPSTNSAHSHAHQHLTLSPGVLSPALDSIRIQWGGGSHGNKEGHKNEKLGHQSLKGTCAHYNFIASLPDPIPSILYTRILDDLDVIKFNFTQILLYT